MAFSARKEVLAQAQPIEHSANAAEAPKPMP